MKVSPCYLFSRSLEFCPAEDIDLVPPGTKGIYVLYQSLNADLMELIYIGVGFGECSGLHGRLKMHRDLQPNVWTHFSVFQVWDNITKKQIKELAGFFRHVFRRGIYAKSVMETKEYKPLIRIQ